MRCEVSATTKSFVQMTVILSPRCSWFIKTRQMFRSVSLFHCEKRDFLVVQFQISA